MKKKLITGLFLSALTGVASAADPGFFFPGGARQDSVIHAPTTSLDGKTVTQWGAAIDSNKSAAAAAQTTANNAASGVSENATAISSETERAKAVESTNASAASAAQNTANDAIPKGQKNAVDGVQNSTNPTVWTGSVTAVGTPSGGEFVGADFPVNYSPTSGGGYGAVAQVDAAQAVQAVVLTSGVCPTSTTATLEINGTSYGTVDISGTTTRGTVLTVTPSGTVAASNIPDAPSDIALASGVSCTTQPQLITYWQPTHATITSAGAGYTSLPSFTSDQSSVSTLAQSTLVATTLGNTTTAPVVQTQNGTPSGVATLNNNSEVVQSVNTTKATLSDTASIGHQESSPLGLTYNGWQGTYGAHEGGPRITLAGSIPNMADQMMLVGGHQLYDSVYSKFTALPYGVGDQGGCVFSVLMSYAPLTGTNCGAGGWDAVTEYDLATNNPPWYMAGTEMPDENGMGHSVTFTLTGAYLRPALPNSSQQFLKKGAHVMTNVVAGDTIFGGPSIDGIQAHQNQDQRFYGNTLSDWTDGSDDAGSYTYLSMTSNWEPTSGDSVTSGHIPSVGTDSGVGTDAYDQVEYSEFSSPVLMIGTYIKHFTRNTSCEVVAESGTDGTAVKRYGPSRKCDEELDNWYTGPDYGATMHGLTLVAGFNNKVSNDSYGIAVSGPWPAGARVWLGTDGIDFDGDEYVTGARKGPAPVIGNKKSMAQWWQEPSADVGYLESVNLWSQVDSISVANNPTTGAASANGQDISYWFGPRQSATKYNLDGYFESAVGFNPNWSKNGVAICGADAAGYFNTSSEGKSCLTLSSTGDISTTGSATFTGSMTTGSIESKGNVTVDKGNSLFLVSSSGGYSTYIFNQDSTSGSTVEFLNNGGKYQSLKADAYIGTLATPSSSTADCTAGQFQDDANYHYVCVATNTWKRVALSSF